ncbi:hypothetical protein H072_4400 [Dactylellina haptotyla CBS 200.50]|uniref:Uncharacterized protein n=1 Tax=Dactylellina haptotyla (strain CBS 200.50) TaxID=1284197 RepID=S8AKT9_DACHA|nr:hypothetical protein H072_4400 [Dactylellina haptotyla CBS 200.50]
MEGEKPKKKAEGVKNSTDGSGCESSWEAVPRRENIIGDPNKNYHGILGIPHRNHRPEKDEARRNFTHRSRRTMKLMNKALVVDPNEYTKRVTELTDMEEAHTFFQEANEMEYALWYNEYVKRERAKGNLFEVEGDFETTSGESSENGKRRPTSARSSEDDLPKRRLYGSFRTPPEVDPETAIEGLFIGFEDSLSSLDFSATGSLDSNGEEMVPLSRETSNRPKIPKTPKTPKTPKAAKAFQKPKPTPKPVDPSLEDDHEYTSIIEWIDSRRTKDTARRAQALVAGEIPDKSPIIDTAEFLASMPQIPWYYEARGAREDRVEAARKAQERVKGSTDEEYLLRLAIIQNPILRGSTNMNIVDPTQNDDEIGDVDPEYEDSSPPPQAVQDPHLVPRETTLEEELGLQVGVNDQAPPVEKHQLTQWWTPMLRSWLWRFFFWTDERMFDPSPVNMTLPKRYRFKEGKTRIDHNFEHVHVCTPGESFFEHLYYSNEHFIWPDSLPTKPPGPSARYKWLRKLNARKLKEKENATLPHKEESSLKTEDSSPREASAEDEKRSTSDENTSWSDTSGSGNANNHEEPVAVPSNEEPKARRKQRKQKKIAS